MTQPPGYPPPPWIGWPPSYPTHWQTNGHQHHDLALGTTLGQLLAGQERQIYISELHTRELAKIHDRLEDLPERMAQAMPAPPPALPPQPTATFPSSPAPSQGLWSSLTPFQRLQVVMAALVVALALAAKVPLEKVLPMALKPFFGL